MMLTEWAIKWGVANVALIDLKKRLGVLDEGHKSTKISGDSEAVVQAKLRLKASCSGGKLWRNNVGAAYAQNGAIVRYGLCNESSAMNNLVKSSDLIGINPIKITRGHVGAVIGQFVAREAKQSGWRYSGTPREKAQLNFISLVIAHGGDAAFSC